MLLRMTNVTLSLSILVKRIDWGNFEGFFTTGIPTFVLISLLFFCVIIITIGLLSNRIVNKSRFIIRVLFIEYLLLILLSTIVCRGAQSFDYARLELVPFWTYRAVLDNVPGVSVWDIILNVLLFIPLGLFTKALFPNTTLIRMVIISVICSVFIETNQYLFEKGIAQIDDVLHNALGGIIGWFIAGLLLNIQAKYRRKNK